MPHRLTNDVFGDIARGTLNPGRQLLPQPLATNACDTADMRDNLWLLYGLVAGLTRPTPDSSRPVRILEIGTSDGTSTLAFLKAAHDYPPEVGRSSVISVDIVDVPVAKALVNHFELQELWQFLQADSKDVLGGFNRDGKEFDLILVDGNHSFEGAAQDVKVAVQCLAPGGFLLFHDALLMAVDHDWTQEPGMRGKPGCGMFARALMSGYAGLGLEGFMLPFGYNLLMLRRRADTGKELNRAYEAAKERGLLM